MNAIEQTATLHKYIHNLVHLPNELFVLSGSKYNKLLTHLIKLYLYVTNIAGHTGAVTKATLLNCFIVLLQDYYNMQKYIQNNPL